jgi:DNA-binding ferritin-like protein
LNIGQLLIASAILGAAVLISRSLNHMSEAVTTALDRLTTDISTVITDVAAAIRDAAGNSTDPATADAINAQAQRLEDFDASLHAPAPAPEPAPEG